MTSWFYFFVKISLISRVFPFLFWSIFLLLICFVWSVFLFFSGLFYFLSTSKKLLFLWLWLFNSYFVSKHISFFGFLLFDSYFMLKLISFNSWLAWLIYSSFMLERCSLSISSRSRFIYSSFMWKHISLGRFFLLDSRLVLKHI